MTREIGLLGYPVAQSVSPALQQAAFDHHSLDIRYRRWPTRPPELAAAVDRLREERYQGANVTIPHKVAVMELLDEVDRMASTIGAVNAIAKRGDRLIGYNTDGDGFIRALREQAGFDVEGRSALLLGAGGAARAAAFALAGQNAAHIVIANRTVERAETLAGALSDEAVEVESIGLDAARLAEAARGAKLIVNCTSVGMAGSDSEGGSPLAAAMIPSGAFVFDMVYNPPCTPLVRAAREIGARAMGGLWMLVYQGASAFEHWTGREPPVDLMYRAGEAALKAAGPRPA